MEMVLMLGMMLMMISTMPVTMMMMTAMISPSGRWSPRRNLPAGDGFSLLYVSAPWRRRNAERTPLLGFLPQGGYIGDRGHRGGAPGIQEGAWRGQEVGPRQA